MKIEMNKQLKKQLPKPKEDKDKVKQWALKGLAGFLVIMGMLTMLSRTASGIITPKVVGTTPQGGRIDYVIEVAGQLRAKEDEKLAVGKGLRVSEVYVEEGQSVKKGEALLELDAKEVKEALLEAERALAKLKLQKEQFVLDQDISPGANSSLKAEETLQRLEEDRARAIKEEDLKIERAEEALKQTQNDLHKAQEQLEQLQTTSVEEQLEEAKKAVEEAKIYLEDQEYEEDKAIKKAELAVQNARANLWKTNGSDATYEIQQFERAKMELEMIKSDWKRIVDKAKKNLQEKKEVVTKLENGEIDKTLIKQQEEKVKQIERQVVEQEGAILDANLTKENRLQILDRQIEDAILEEENALKQEVQEYQKEDIQLQLMSLDIEAKQEEIAKLQEIASEEGKWIAPSDGVITEIKITEGDIISEETVMTFVPDEISYVFEAEISEEESKHLEVGDEVTIKLQNDKLLKNVAISQIMPIKEALDGRRKVSVEVPEGTPNMIATMELVKSSKQYQTVLPIEALRENNNSTYILVAKEKDTTLGKQLVVEQIEVMVLEKNHKKVALQAPLDKKDRVIIKSNKPLQAGDHVRLIEE